MVGVTYVNHRFSLVTLEQRKRLTLCLSRIQSKTAVVKNDKEYSYQVR